MNRTYLACLVTPLGGTILRTEVEGFPDTAYRHAADHFKTKFKEEGRDPTDIGPVYSIVLI